MPYTPPAHGWRTFWIVWVTQSVSVIGSALTFTNPLAQSHTQAIWQTQTPHELQGRVFSVRRLIAQCAWPLGTLLGGIVGGLFNPGRIITLLGAFIALFCLAQLLNPEFGTCRGQREIG